VGVTTLEVHSEALVTPSAQPEDMRFEFSVDGDVTWTQFDSYPGTSTSDPNYDQWIWLPVVSGPFRIRVIDANRTTGSSGLDGISIDQLWIRTAP
jgi:hypothetical protein